MSLKDRIVLGLDEKELNSTDACWIMGSSKPISFCNCLVEP
jgi:hypothetical protein